MQQLKTLKVFELTWPLKKQPLNLLKCYRSIQCKNIENLLFSEIIVIR